MGLLQETRKRKKIIVVALSISLVALILGLGLGLGLELQKWKDRVVPQTSCRGRCYEPFDGEIPGCRCDSGCNQTQSCCVDFYDICTQPAEQWQCTRLRCGEKRLSNSNCHCSDDCGANGDCCTNYRHVCEGEKQWVQGDCDDLSTAQCPKGFRTPPLLLVSLDGWRAEYLRSWSRLVPVVHKLQTCGTSAPFMQAAFPSKTFPNHYTIVTGLYPESNGLIDNTMYDPDRDASFSLSSPEKDNPVWYLGQPIWHTASYQGLRSGTFFWPGSDVKVNGSFPDIYKPYDGKIPFEERVFTILRWLQLPDDQRPDFLTLYLEEPDKSGHSFGPVSGGLIEALQAMDLILGQLMNGLQQLGLHRCVNIIVVADHGMEDTSCDRKEALQDLVGDVQGLWVTQGPFGRVRARDKNKPIDAAGLVANMTCRKPEQKIRPYLKQNLPKRLHFAHSPRIEELNVLVTPQWLFESSPGSLTFCSGGNHGYDNDVETMNAMFLSYGPKFKPQTVVEPFSNIELYNLMCDLLEIFPVENNGTHGALNHLQRAPFYSPTAPPELSPPQACHMTSLDPPGAQGCSCNLLPDNSINDRLNLTSAQVEASEKTHVPFGRPALLQEGQSLCVLRHEGFVSGYSRDKLMPLWTSYTPEPASSAPLGPLVLDCLRPDVRVPPEHSPSCEVYNSTMNISFGFLFPPNLNSSAQQPFDALTTSNLVPMFPPFKKIWSYFHDTLLPRYSRLYGRLNVATGPIFDYDFDGRYDSSDQILRFVPGSKIPVPTHFFIVLTSCSNSSSSVCDQPQETVSFVLPHREDNTESCQSSGAESEWVEDLMWFHQSRVRDVEWLTGLDFYQGSSRPITELLQMKTRPTADIHPKLQQPPF
ncbi:venom phosphodiesterase CdcPDE [Eucyclogobius newberryi]|uniref:venom phosphodiesterase CdcPDE n=1 Tax=Eucyclogobius newberryi TaxID=166745 RepID=UPI003B5985AF